MHSYGEIDTFVNSSLPQAIIRVPKAERQSILLLEMDHWWQLPTRTYQKLYWSINQKHFMHAIMEPNLYGHHLTIDFRVDYY